MCDEITTIDGIGEYEIWENTAAIYSSMELSAAYLNDSFEKVLVYIQETNQQVVNYVQTANGGRRLNEHHREETLKIESGRDQIIEAIAAHAVSNTQEFKAEMNEMETKLDGLESKMKDLKSDLTTLDLAVQVLSRGGKKDSANTVTLMVLATVNGLAINADVDILGFDEATEEEKPLPYTSKDLGSSVLYKVKNENSNNVLIFKASHKLPEGASGSGSRLLERSELVSIV